MHLTNICTYWIFGCSQYIILCYLYNALSMCTITSPTQKQYGHTRLVMELTRVGQGGGWFASLIQNKQTKKKTCMMVKHFTRFTILPNRGRAELNMQGETCYTTLHLLQAPKKETAKPASTERWGQLLLLLVEMRTPVTKGRKSSDRKEC